MNKSGFLIPLFFFASFFLSCKKDKKVDPPATPSQVVSDTAGKIATIAFDMKAFVNGKSLNDTTWYVNFNADSFTVKRFNYYISNIKLKRSDGFVYSESESYHLIKHLDGKETFTISNVPEGSYSGIELIIGVDSARNVSGAQTGDLDVVQGMFWEWNTGYIFFKLEGDCKVAANPNLENYGWHIGGYSAVDGCLQKCSFSLPTPIVVAKGKKSTVFYHANVEEIFIHPQNLDINSICLDPVKLFRAVSANYADMLKIDHVQN